MIHHIKAKTSTTFIDNFLGLHLLRNNPVLLLQTRFGVHTLLLKSSIDIVILDRIGQVKVIRENLPPNRFFFYNPKYYHVLELPGGYIAKKKLQLADKIILEP